MIHVRKQKLTDPGYRLPAIIDPGTTQCIRVYVPDSQLYLAAFWSSYEFFTMWLAWERDEAHRGKQAASVWKSAFERSREEFDCAGGECGIVNVRQSESAPCELEKQVECDGSWEQFALLSDCVPEMRLLAVGNGFVIQQLTSSGWTTTSEETAPYEDRTDGPYVPAWTTPPIGQLGNCLAAANTAWWLDDVLTKVAQLHVDLAAIATILASAIAWIAFCVDATGLHTDWALALMEMFAQFAGDWQDVVNYSMLWKLAAILYCRYEEDGSMTLANYELVLGDMTAYRATLEDEYKRVKWSLAIMFVQAVGPVGLSRLAVAAGILEANCGSYDCGWFVEFDFHTSDCDWSVEEAPWDEGTWIVTVGWRAQLGHPDIWRKYHYIGLEFPQAGVVTGIDHLFSLLWGTFTPGNIMAYAMRLWLGEVLVYNEEVSCDEMEEGENQLAEWHPGGAGGIEADKITLFVSCSRNSESEDGHADTHHVRMEGIGPNPWS